jgi:hypothetical protein
MRAVGNERLGEAGVAKSGRLPTEAEPVGRDRWSRVIRHDVPSSARPAP